MPIEYRLYALCGLLMLLWRLLATPAEEIRDGFEHTAKNFPLPITQELVAVGAAAVAMVFWPYILALDLLDLIRGWKK